MLEVTVRKYWDKPYFKSCCGFASCGAVLRPGEDYLIRIGKWWWGACRHHIQDFLEEFQKGPNKGLVGSWVSKEEE